MSMNGSGGLNWRLRDGHFSFDTNDVLVTNCHKPVELQDRKSVV